MEQLRAILDHIHFENVLLGLLVLALCLALSRWLMRLLNRLLKRSRHIDASLHRMLKTMLRILLYGLSFLFAANTMGIPITSFLALFSVVGLAVSLAVQGVLSNLAGGIIILASKPFTLGDFIETDAVSGTVKDIGFLHTRMIAPDGKMIFVPNNLLYNSKLINYTSSGKRRMEITLNMDLDSDPESVRAAALEAIAQVSGILADPAPEILLENYADGALQYTVRVWAHTKDYFAARYALNEALLAALRRRELKIGHPHLNVHMH